MKRVTSFYLLWDFIFASVLTTISLSLVFFYFRAEYLSAGYPDWMVHAFRIKSLSDFGFLSWTHVWANGISLWKAYQFIPHYLTLGIVQLFHVPIPRAMVIITIILFVLLRFFIYFSLRLLKFKI